MKKIIAVLLFVMPSPAFSQISLWTEDASSTQIPPVFEDTISSIRVSFNEVGILGLASGDSVSVTLEAGMIKTAVIDTINQFDDTVQIIGHIVEEPDSLIEIQFDGKNLNASVQLGMSEIGYRLALPSGGIAFLLKQEIEEFICEGIPPAPEDSIELASKSFDLSLAQPLAIVSSVPIYSSNAGASRVIYLDFDGETINNTPWNAQFNGNAPIVAQPFDLDGSPSTFNDAEQTFIRNVWERTREAYSIYQVNVTTDKSVFNATAAGSRLRMLISPTHEWYTDTRGNAGGVAYRPSFGNDWPAWGFSTFGGGREGANMGLISVHEIGHTLNLEHDGLNGAEYHTGQQGWGPFMGAPYRSSYTTFSDGGYAGSTENQPDLSIISSRIPFISDGVGNSNVSALSATSIESKIGAFNDIDVYQFQAKKGEKIIVNVTALGEFPTVNTQITLYSSTGTQLADNNQAPISPFPFPASVSLNSKISYFANETGTYYLHVKGNSYDGGSNYNHSAYGAVGRYGLEISVNNIMIVPVIMLLLDDEPPS